MTKTGRVQLRDLWVDLKEFHLREIDLDIPAGEYFVLLGPTGAGKTVLLETIAGLYAPQKGRILVDGEDITFLPPERRGAGFVYQDYALFPHLTVADNIAFGLKLRRVPRKVADEQVSAMSRLLGVEHLLHRRPRTLSGGEQQRVALARALVIGPRLLLLDEPLSALDPETREGLRRELARIHQQLGTTTLHVTHDFEEAVALGDRVAIVNAGRIVQVGSPDDIFRRPASEFVARFVGVRNIFLGEIKSGSPSEFKTFSFGSVDIVVVTERTGVVHASIRPEDVIISKEPLRSSARNCFPGRIVEIADRGTLVYVTVRIPSEGDRKSPPDFTCVITRRSLDEMDLQEYALVHISFKASAVHVF
ncbi:MAG: tungstate ABC transporter ATP-binding protein WtpC [Chloroflexota bacterium]|nr:tungstate ABC transporter ATP-binding protein WtpC [Chloroflexota bacterium]